MFSIVISQKRSFGVLVKDFNLGSNHRKLYDYFIDVKINSWWHFGKLFNCPLWFLYYIRGHQSVVCMKHSLWFLYLQLPQNSNPGSREGDLFQGFLPTGSGFPKTA